MSILPSGFLNVLLCSVLFSFASTGFVCFSLSIEIGGGERGIFLLGLILKAFPISGGSVIRVKSRIIMIKLISFKDFNELPLLPSRERERVPF